MRPYQQYPKLFNNLKAMFQQGNNESTTSRQELVRVLGILGAYDPFKLLFLQSEDGEKQKVLAL